MAFGRPSHQGQTTTSHVRWPMWKAGICWDLWWLGLGKPPGGFLLEINVSELQWNCYDFPEKWLSLHPGTLFTFQDYEL